MGISVSFVSIWFAVVSKTPLSLREELLPSELYREPIPADERSAIVDAFPVDAAATRCSCGVPRGRLFVGLGLGGADDFSHFGGTDLGVLGFGFRSCGKQCPRDPGIFTPRIAESG